MRRCVAPLGALLGALVLLVGPPRGMTRPPEAAAHGSSSADAQLSPAQAADEVLVELQDYFFLPEEGMGPVFLLGSGP